MDYKVEAGNLNAVANIGGMVTNRPTTRHEITKSSILSRTAMTEEELKKAKIIAYGVAGGVTLTISIGAAIDAWKRTHLKSRAVGAFLCPPVWFLVR